MKTTRSIIPICILAILTAVFFYQTVLFGKIPFPGDSLMSDFQPWRSSSYMGYAAGGVPSKAQYPDTIRQIYPWKTLVVESLRRGKLPLWNPYNFSGTPLLANFQSAALYPLNAFYLFLSQISAWTVLIMLQPLLAAVFTYFYMRTIRATPYGAMLAAVSYGFSGFMAVWLEYNTVGHVILWLPLILLAIEHLNDSKHPRLWFPVLAIANAAAVLAGHPQVYAYLAAFAACYAWSRLPRHGRVIFFTGTTIGIGIGGIQLLPGLELIAHAARSPHDADVLFSKILIQPWQLLALPFPNLFGNPATRTYWPADTFVGKVTTIGLVPLFFLLSAFRRTDRTTRWHLWAAGIVALLVTANPVTYVLYRLPIPVISSSSPTLMTFLLSFSLAVTCGLGLDFWITDRHTAKKLVRRAMQVAVLLGIMILAAKLPFVPDFHRHAAIAIKAILYGGVLAAGTLGLFWVAITYKQLMRLSVIVMLLMHTADLFVFFARFNPFVPARFVFPDHPVLTYLSKHAPDRYWGYGTARIDANFASQYHMFSPEGYDPLYPEWYGTFLYGYRLGEFANIFDDSTRSDAAIGSHFGDGGLSDRNKKRILDALSVRYVLDRTENASTQQVFPTGSFRNVQSLENWTVYENTGVLPRAFIARNTRVADDTEEIGRIFFAPDFDPRTTAIVPSIADTRSLQSATGTADITSYEPEHLVIRTESDKDALLVVTDTFDPNWRATVDGISADIIPVNIAFRGVAVPGGSHTVTMSYAPRSVTIGSVISIGSIIALCVRLLFF